MSLKKLDTPAGRFRQVRGTIPRLAVIFVIAVVVGVGVGWGLSLWRGSTHDGRTSKAQAARKYLDAVEPLAKKGGEVVQLGLKAGINDIRDRRYPASVLENMSWAWLRDLRSTARAWRDIDPPAELQRAHSEFLRALDGYVEAAVSVHASARARGNERAVYLDEAILRGESSDDVWDHAVELCRDYLGEIKVPVPAWFGEA